MYYKVNTFLLSNFNYFRHLCIRLDSCGIKFQLKQKIFDLPIKRVSLVRYYTYLLTELSASYFN